MKLRLNLLCVAATLGTLMATVPASAVTLWGTTASGFARDCTGGNCGNVFVQTLADGGPGIDPAAVAMSVPRPAGIDFSASSTFVGALLLPELKAFASADSPDRFQASAQATGSQVYTDLNGGTVAIDVALGGSTTGSMSSVSGYVIVYDAASYDPSNLELPGHRLANAALSIGGTQSGTLSFDLLPGQSYYVVAALFANADSLSTPSIADGGHTLTMAYTEATGVNVGLVPEPGTWTLWLAGLGFGGLVARQRPSRI